MSETRRFESNLSSGGYDKIWTDTIGRPLPRKNKAYGRNAQRSYSSSSKLSENTKGKKRGLYERQQEPPSPIKAGDAIFSLDDRTSEASLESTEHSASSLSSFDAVNARLRPAELNRRALSDLDRSSRFRRQNISSLSRYGSFSDYDSENVHPNLNQDGENTTSHLPPSKVKKIHSKPFHRHKSYDIEVDHKFYQQSPGNQRKRQIVRSQSLDLNKVLHQSGRHSPSFSNASSSSSFSFLAKTGSSGHSWVKNSLENASKSISNKNNVCSFEGPYSDHDTIDTTTTPCANSDNPSERSVPILSCGIDVVTIVAHPSTPERVKKRDSLDSSHSSRKRGVCDSPSVSLHSSPSSSRLSRLHTRKTARSRSRSRFFSCKRCE